MKTIKLATLSIPDDAALAKQALDIWDRYEAGPVLEQMYTLGGMQEVFVFAFSRGVEAGYAQGAQGMIEAMGANVGEPAFVASDSQATAAMTRLFGLERATDILSGSADITPEEFTLLQDLRIELTDEQHDPLNS